MACPCGRFPPRIHTPLAPPRQGSPAHPRGPLAPERVPSAPPSRHHAAAYTCSGLIRSLPRLRTETLGAHRARQAAEVGDQLPSKSGTPVLPDPDRPDRPGPAAARPPEVKFTGSAEGYEVTRTALATSNRKAPGAAGAADLLIGQTIGGPPTRGRGWTSAPRRTSARRAEPTRESGPPRRTPPSRRPGSRRG